VPIAKEMGIDMKKHNLLEFTASWDAYQINATPTLIHYKDGKEVSRLEGGRDGELWKQWFEEQKQGS
jgi:thioredoxin 1